MILDIPDQAIDLPFDAGAQLDELRHALSADPITEADPDDDVDWFLTVVREHPGVMSAELEEIESELINRI